MNKQADVLSKIEEWAQEGLISPQQATRLREREAYALVTYEARVRTDEILVYLGSLVVFLALAFLVFLNWRTLGSAGRILSLLLPMAAMLVGGVYLRRAPTARLQRGAQALWMAGCLLLPFVLGVTLYELEILPAGTVLRDLSLQIISALVGTLVAAVAYALLPTIVQSITMHLLGTATLISVEMWLGESFGYLPWAELGGAFLLGGVWLSLAWWLKGRGQERLALVSQAFGALTLLLVSFTVAANATVPEVSRWEKTTFEIISVASSIAFIIASVRQQSPVFLYSGTAFLLFFITYVNFQYFADEVGMPVALFLTGAVLIILGLTAERLRQRMRLVH